MTSDRSFRQCPIFGDHLIDQAKTIVILDRNVASRMAKVAKEGACWPLDEPTQVAVDLMALAQSMDLDLEPAIAFKELAHTKGNTAALDELRWFRAADVGQAHAWFDLALGRTDALPTKHPPDRENHDLEQPLQLWRCNYVVLLKATELARSDLSSVERARALYRWMASNFIIVGSAALYSSMFFSPCARKAGMFKKLRSPDRERALAGIRNAAWDVTYLGYLTQRVKSEPHGSKRFILATADRALAEIAPLLFSDAENAASLRADLAAKTEHWWGSDAVTVATFAVEAHEEAERRSSPEWPEGFDRHIDCLIRLGETNILGP